eukprot:gene40-57_t
MLQDLIALFFPNTCFICKKSLITTEIGCCMECLLDLPTTNYHEEMDNPVAQRLCGSVAITYAMALYHFKAGNGVQRLIHYLKYGDQPAIGELLGKLYGTQLGKKTDWGSPFTCIVPIPLHPKRLKERGYNQSDYFAKGMAEALHIPWYSECVQRIKNTKPQTGQGREGRLENLQSAFKVVYAAYLYNQHVLLVDDMITTGATLEACARSILAAGAKEVSIATIGITD